MPTEPTPITVSDLVSRAQAIVDVDGLDDAVTAFAQRHEDDAVPVRSVLASLEERIDWGADEDPPVVMAQAIVLYLAHRPEQVDSDGDEILRLAARAEFDGMPPEDVQAWLAGNGIDV